VVVRAALAKRLRREARARTVGRPWDQLLARRNLIGAEQVQNAGRQMDSAADRIRRAVEGFEFHVERFVSASSELVLALDRLTEAVSKTALKDGGR
jgi:hypothetical protein